MRAITLRGWLVECGSDRHEGALSTRAGVVNVRAVFETDKGAGETYHLCHTFVVVEWNADHVTQNQILWQVRHRKQAVGSGREWCNRRSRELGLDDPEVPAHMVEYGARREQRI